MRVKKGLAGLASIGLLAGAAMAPASVAAQDDINLIVVSHGQPSDPFWSVVQNGVVDAADKMGVNVTYTAPEGDTFDIVKMAQLIDTAVATDPDGLIVSIPDASALGPSITAAIDAGIPVISMNSGSDVYKDLGILTHVGQTEYAAGFGGGEAMAAAGVTNGLCVNQEIGNVALDLRCEGFAEALTKAGAEVQPPLGVQLSDPAGTQATIEATLGADPGIDGVLTLGPTGATPALKAFEELDILGDVQLATFDLSADVLQAIVDGQMLFAIDQQQYLQGYLPVVMLTLYNQYGGLLPGGGGIVLTGPGFVTQENAAAVIELSQLGIR
jgi:simple sugar transport system substrate-binding protein